MNLTPIYDEDGFITGWIEGEPMFTLPHLTIKTYGGLATSDSEYRFSGTGGGTSGPPKPKEPVQKPEPPAKEEQEEDETEEKPA